MANANHMTDNMCRLMTTWQTFTKASQHEDKSRAISQPMLFIQTPYVYKLKKNYSSTLFILE